MPSCQYHHQYCSRKAPRYGIFSLRVRCRSRRNRRRPLPTTAGWETRQTHASRAANTTRSWESASNPNYGSFQTVRARCLEKTPNRQTIMNLYSCHSRRFREWSKEYGSVFSLKLGSANVVVLCDRKAIHKLLVEKGANFSDRPNTYVGQLLTQGDHVALQQMDTTWREKRKVISHTFSPKQLDENHYKVQEAECVTITFFFFFLLLLLRRTESKVWTGL